MEQNESGSRAALEQRHTIRLDEETNSKLIAKAGGKKLAEYIREIIIEHLKAAQEQRSSRNNGKARECWRLYSRFCVNKKGPMIRDEARLHCSAKR